jgi:mono/diheme cytochrome c family protein
MPSKTVAVCVLVACTIVPAAFAARKEKPMNDAQTKELFATTCGWCHSDGGRQAGKGPKLAGTQRSDSFIVNRIKHGKEGAMPAFEGSLSDTQIRGIIHYIRNLKSD